MGGLLKSYTRSGSDDDGQDPQSYEALLISALIESGQFTPARLHVTSDDIVGWGKVWAFCRDYQEKAGSAPTAELVMRMYPEFIVTTGVSASWAASKVHEESASREMRIRSGAMLAALGEGDVTGAYQALSGISPPRLSRREPADIFDTSTDETIDEMVIEVPYPTLEKLTRGGLKAAEFMLLGARLAQGKSQIAARFASLAASLGWNVCVLSYEMPQEEYALRILKHMAGPRRRLFDMLDGDDLVMRKKAISQLREETPGSIRIFDPAYGDIARVNMIAEVCRDYDFVIGDHLGLAKTATGKRAIEDWRIFAEISNIVRETTLETRTPVLGIVQINREGVHRGSMQAPTPENIAGTDALGQDATIIVTFKRLSKRIAKFTAGKVRNGPTGSWYARYDPAENRWDEINQQLALEISADDEAMDD